MNNDFKNSDERLREKLDGFRMAAPEGAWAGIEGNIGGKAGGRGKFFYLWMALLFVGVTGAGVLTFLLMNNNDDKNAAQSSVVAANTTSNEEGANANDLTTQQSNKKENAYDQQDSPLSDAVRSGNTEASTNHQNSSASNVNASNSTSSSIGSNASNSSQNSSTASNSGSNNSNNVASNNTSNTSANTSANNSNLNQSSGNSSGNNEIATNASNNSNATNANTNSSNSDGNSEVKGNDEKEDVAQNNSSENNAEKTVESTTEASENNAEKASEETANEEKADTNEASNNTAPSNENNSLIDEKEKVKPSWSIEGGADLSRFNMSHTSSDAQLQESLNTAYSQNSGMGAFLRFNYQPFQRFSFHSGLEYSQNNATQDYAWLTVSTIYNYDTTGWYIDSVTQQPVYIVDTIETELYADHQAQFKSTVSQVSIPLGVMFHVPLGAKSELGINLTGLVGIRTGSTGEILIDQNGNTVATMEAYRQVNFSARTALRYSYFIGTKSILYIEPYVGFGLNDRSSTTLPFGSKFRNYGIRVGFRYNF